MKIKTIKFTPRATLPKAKDKAIQRFLSSLKRAFRKQPTAEIIQFSAFMNGRLLTKKTTLN